MPTPYQHADTADEPINVLRGCFWAFACNPPCAGEQTLVPLPGELLPIDIYDVYDSFLSQSISLYSTASPSDSRTLTVAVKNNGIPSVAVEYMDQIPQLQQYHDEQGSPARVFSATQVL